MNKSDTAELLAFCAAFDQRTLGSADVEAWALALADVPWDGTTREAVAGFYSARPTAGEDETARRFIQPHHVRHARAKIRKDRIERLPMPCPNDVPGVSEGDEIRAIEGAIADGAITTWAELVAYEKWGGSLHLARQAGRMPQLEGPEPADHGPIELGRVFQAVPGEDYE